MVLGWCAVAAVVALRAHVVLPDSWPPGLRADVLVMGGSPAGVAAAVAAARAGMIVVLVEPRPFLGTVWTGAMLNMLDLNRLPDGRPLTGGIFRELYRQLGGITFDPRRAREVLRALVEAERGITLLLRSTLQAPVLAESRVRGAVVRLPDGRDTLVEATITIDATDDGDLAAAAGVPYTYGREASGIDRRAMPATLLFRLADVDWFAVARYAYLQRRGRHPSGTFQGYAWGFRDLLADYRPAQAGLSVWDLNLGRLPDGTVLVNALQIHDVDGTDRASRQMAYARGKHEIPRLVAYLRERVPGVARARLVEVAPELYIRETRHFRGLYTLTVRDIMGRTHFWDRIAVASYPIDLHVYRPGEHGAFRALRRPYTIPLRALIPAAVDNLFLASRAFSATYQAAGSARVVPTTIAMGEAAGTAAAVAVRHGVTPHILAGRPDLVWELQRRLVRRGAAIDF